jgi:Flp pilus assembly protein TadD
MAVLAQGRPVEALQFFERALEADPLHGPTHFQLGLMLQRDGRLEEASSHLSTALSARPTDPDVLLAAGVLDALRGDDASAILRLRGALQMRPGWANAQAALASVLSSKPSSSTADRQEAVALAESANEQTAFGNSAFLDILAVTLANTGDVSRALSVARQGLSRADTAGDRAAAEALRARVADLESRPH